MELKLSEFVITLNDKLVTMEALVDHWQRTHAVEPANAQTCYGYYRPDMEGGEYMHVALWHPDTAPDKDERMVPGYFIPQVEYARYGINEAHQLLCNVLGLHFTVTDALERDVMDALQKVWAPQDKWKSAVLVAMKRAGWDDAETLANVKDPEEALRQLALYWQSYGQGMASVEALEASGLSIELKTPTSEKQPKQIVSYCNSCERPDFNGHDHGCPNDVEVIPEPADDSHIIDDDVLWPPSGLYRHTDGGMYEVIYGASSSEDKSRVVVYRHRWPFEPGVWTRPYSEWNSRFTPITSLQYAAEVDSRSQQDAQTLVTACRKQRKAKEAQHLQNLQDEAQGLDPRLDELNDIEIRSGSLLYDAQGKLWKARVPTLKGYTLMMCPEQHGEHGDGDAAVWHTNVLNPEGLPALFWNNPQEDLKLRWSLRRLNDTVGWETQTPFGLLQIEHQPRMRYPWHIRSLCNERGFDAEEGWATANSAMKSVERRYFNKLKQAQSKQ